MDLCFTVMYNLFLLWVLERNQDTTLRCDRTFEGEYTFCILQKLKTFYLYFQRIVPLQLIDSWEDSRSTSTFKEVIMISDMSLCHMEAFIPIHYYIDKEGMTVR